MPTDIYITYEFFYKMGEIFGAQVGSGRKLLQYKE